MSTASSSLEAALSFYIRQVHTYKCLSLLAFPCEVTNESNDTSELIE